MNQLILSAEAVNPDPKPLDDLIAVLKGTMKSYGYNDTVGLMVNNGWHPVSEKPTEYGEYWVYSPAYSPGKLARFVDPEWLDDSIPGHVYVIKGLTHWQSLPEPPESEEVEK